jgi:glycosyltransferase involved in cell wall biosynthesis
MRTSLSPLKNNVPLPPPPLISACVVTHYTNEKYHAQRMDVVRLCLNSIIAGLQGSSYELLIWDNGSTPEFREMLRGYKSTVLIESVNVGAHNARHNLAEIARGEVVCFTDDDILFHPEWLSLQMEVLTVFPNVGLVSGSPYRWAFKWGQTVKIPDGITVREGNFIPEQYIKDACASVGQDYTSSMWQLRDIKDVLLEYKGVKAYNHGHHMQLLAHRDIIKPFMFQSKFYLAHGRKLNEDVMAAGYLQLTTHRRTAIHCGNFIDTRLRDIIKEWKIQFS